MHKQTQGRIGIRGAHRSRIWVFRSMAEEASPLSDTERHRFRIYRDWEYWEMRKWIRWQMVKETTDTRTKLHLMINYGTIDLTDLDDNKIVEAFHDLGGCDDDLFPF